MQMQEKIFHWRDPLRMDSQLAHEEKQIFSSVQDFSRNVLQPKVISAFRNELQDSSIIRMNKDC